LHSSSFPEITDVSRGKFDCLEIYGHVIHFQWLAYFEPNPPIYDTDVLYDQVLLRNSSLGLQLVTVTIKLHSAWSTEPERPCLQRQVER